jgi:hypothetical protein
MISKWVPLTLRRNDNCRWPTLAFYKILISSLWPKVFSGETDYSHLWHWEVKRKIWCSYFTNSTQHGKGTLGLVWVWMKFTTWFETPLHEPKYSNRSGLRCSSVLCTVHSASSAEQLHVPRPLIHNNATDWNLFPSFINSSRRLISNGYDSSGWLRYQGPAEWIATSCMQPSDFGILQTGIGLRL